MKKTILIVEDEFQIRKDLELILNLNNYDVISAENGKDALKLMDTFTPDLIISDIMMPKMNGYELLENVQKIERLATIPFLFLTAKTDKKDFREGMTLGADDFITKPFNIDELLEAIQSRFKKKEKTEKIINDTFEDLRLSIKYSLPHEIRNPINVILGFSDLLKNHFDNTTKEEALEMLDNIYNSGMRLNNIFENYILIANLEMLQKSERDKLQQLQHITKSVDLIIKDTATEIALQYERIDDLLLELQDDSIYINEDFFVKLIAELTDNAFKFSDKNTKVSIKSFSDNYFHIIEVLNLGRGIKPEQLSRIGEYIQFERKLYEQQGLGLGLAIVKKIIDLFNGIFKIDSEVGKFTKVTIKIPRVKQ